MKDKTNKKDYAKKMKEKKDGLYEKANSQLEEVMADPYKFISFLKLMGNVNYSVTNSLLVFSENPDATLLRSVEAWEEKGIHVRDGETGIEILAPGNEYTRRDGSKGIYFDPKFVFDISQTDKESLKEYETKFEMIQEALSNSYKVAILNSSVSGIEYSQRTGEMLVPEGLDPDTSLNQLFKEFARIDLSKQNIDEAETNYLCDCVGYMLSNRYHTKGYNTHLIVTGLGPVFMTRETDEIKSKLNIMYRVYKKMKDAINKEISLQYQEKNGQ